MSEQQFTAGDVVRLAQPQPGEESSRFVIAEWNGDRGYIRLVGDRMAIPSVELVRTGDLVLVAGYRVR